MIRTPSTFVRPSLVRRLAPLVLLFTLTACGGREDPGDDVATPTLPFDITRPAARHVLPDILTEISGLAALDEHHVAAVQDEAGIVFVLDLRDGSIAARHAFGSAGDYEGLALRGDTLHVLRSDGRLTTTTAWRSDAPQSTERIVPAGRACDAEGLSFDGPRLLVACKARAVIYAFDPDHQTLDTLFTTTGPAYSTAPRDRSALERRLRRLFGAGREGFRPSAVALRPRTGERWVLSAEPPAVAVVGSDGALRILTALPRASFPKPEGLTFTPGGDLVIASEGIAAGTASLTRFRRPPSSHD